MNDDDRSNAFRAIWWFGVALVPLVASQVLRLHQHQAASWLALDYAGRIVALATLAAIPSARAVAFRRDKLEISFAEITVWIIGIVILERLSQWPRRLINAAFPLIVLGRYPQPTGWLNVFDLAFGLALVAASEEIIFRRYLHEALRPYLGDGTLALLTASALFGAYHWWTGIGNILLAVIVGSSLMLMLRRSTALWPVVLAHYLVDLIAFSSFVRST
ncbi:CPBP family intramembrane glutamic endopeptidase [Bradyrhizobium sp. CCBAU 51627]|uniref:CPBP family intramembrane glutamic endopeptidase n=1 Tax=Bradyrhizobium sp. CCBAU 51627 TaxID=1325088 RepID=UPI0023066AE2|nr:CPBP family intramembrane glutamic endopeptidase [Bradyrhizobium sp. CCBAU 51627]MDA9436750.1 membrane protein [Bradyrhizobium sp. CCBAU 51627]